MTLDAASVAEFLGLEPLPEEGGRFRETFADAHSTAIYYLVAPPEFSAMHRLAQVETFHFYAGAPARMLLLHEGGAVEEPVLGADLAAGQRPQCTVAAGCWQGSESLGAWTLLGTTVAPPFAWSGFELGRRDELARGWPSAAERIVRLTRA